MLLLTGRLDRQSRVRQRNIDFNTELAAVCALPLYTPCLFDGNAVFKTQFTTTDVCTRDFSITLAGQKKLASVTWSAGYWGPWLAGSARGTGIERHNQAGTSPRELVRTVLTCRRRVTQCLG